MYYKVYIDSVFILQTAGNVYLLSLAGKVLKCTATHGRIWLGAVTGALLVCMAMLVPVGTIGVKILISAVPVSMCMLRIAFRMDHSRRFIHGSLVMAGCGFFLGSIMIWIMKRLRTVLRGSVSLFVTIAVGYIAYRILIWILMSARKKSEDCLRTVSVYVPKLQRELRIQAFMDTGNHLTDPVSGAPVCLISEELAEQMASCFRPEKYHAIPYRSVGKDNGILHGYELSELIIEQEQRVIKKHVIVAICNTGISKESIYQMILHPRLLED